MMKLDDLLEALSRLEHDQWVSWSKSIAPDINDPKRKARWEKLWCDYSLLSEADKEKDREWGRKVLKIIRDFLDNKEMK